MTLAVLSGCQPAPEGAPPTCAAHQEISTPKGEIDYRGGPMMLNPINLYVIWYGDWANPNTRTILTDFLTNIGGSEYFAINASYHDNQGRRVKNVVTYRQATTDHYSQWSHLSLEGAKEVVESAVLENRLARDPDGVYLVFTAPGVTGDFLGLTYGGALGYCGYHWHHSVLGTELKFAVIGDPASAPACRDVPDFPNGDMSADNMASIAAHEISEAVTDPLPDTARAWAGLGQPPHILENADVCQGKYGTNRFWAGSGWANSWVGNRGFMLHQNLLNDGDMSYCASDLVPDGFDRSRFTWDWRYYGQNWGERYDLVPGDYNGDGRADLYLHSRQGAHEGDYLALSEGATYAWSWLWPYGAGSWDGWDVVPGDFNGDGKTDHYLHGRPGTGWGDYMGLSNGTSIHVWNWFWPYPGLNWNDWEAVPGDFNGDGRTDILMHGRAGTQVSDLLITSTGGGFDPQVWYSPHGSWSDWQVVTGDYNGDGKTDIYLHARPGTHRGDYMATSNGGGFNVWTWAWPYGNGSWDSADAFAADFDGDGRSDLFLHGRPNTGWGDYMGVSNGSSFQIWTWQSHTTWNDREISLADFNGDGRADIFVHASPTSNDVDHIVVPTGSALNGWSWSGTSSWRSFVVVPGDYDGNGHADVYLHGRPNSPFGDYMFSNPIP